MHSTSRTDKEVQGVKGERKKKQRRKGCDFGEQTAYAYSHILLGDLPDYITFRHGLSKIVVV